VHQAAPATSRQHTGQPQIPAPISGQNKRNPANHFSNQDQNPAFRRYRQQRSAFSSPLAGRVM